MVGVIIGVDVGLVSAGLADGIGVGLVSITVPAVGVKLVSEESHPGSKRTEMDMTNIKSMAIFLQDTSPSTAILIIRHPQKYK